MPHLTFASIIQTFFKKSMMVENLEKFWKAVETTGDKRLSITPWPWSTGKCLDFFGDQPPPGLLPKVFNQTEIWEPIEGSQVELRPGFHPTTESEDKALEKPLRPQRVKAKSIIGDQQFLANHLKLGQCIPAGSVMSRTGQVVAWKSISSNLLGKQNPQVLPVPHTWPTCQPVPGPGLQGPLWSPHGKHPALCFLL